MNRMLRHFTAGLHRRVMLMVARAALKRVDDSGALQRLQLSVLNGELRDQVARWQEYGFSSVPLPGAAAILLSLAGSRDHPAAVAVDDGRYRPRNGQEGDVALYTKFDDPDAPAEAARHRVTLTERDGQTCLIVRVDRFDLVAGPNSLTMDEAGVRLVTPDFEATQPGGGA